MSASVFVHGCVMCVVGRADKQAMGWEVEGLHRLGLLTLFWQNIMRRAPRNLAGGAQQSDPLHPTYSTEKTHPDRLPRTPLCLFLQLSMCSLSALDNFVKSYLLYCRSLSLGVWHSVIISQDGMLRDIQATRRPRGLRSPTGDFCCGCKFSCRSYLQCRRSGQSRTLQNIWFLKNMTLSPFDHILIC